MAHDEHSSPELDLGPFVASTRRVLDRTASERHRAGMPPPPSLPPASRRLALLVAAAVLVVGGTVLALASADVLQRNARSTASEAEHTVAHQGPQLVAPSPTNARPEPELHEVTTAANEPTPSLDAPDEPPAPRADDTAAPDEGHPAQEGPVETEGSKPDEEPPSRSKADLHAELARLDAEAQRRWKAGDVAGAEALFLKIVERGGRNRYAELAFGDLFTLAHKAGDARREQRLWRRYLSRFPRGRFADDVRAWQCRRAAGDEGTRCWRRYLEDWPRGTYRSEADRAVGTDEASR